jgi:multisubunit Na+/H+ antiporter MnhF subunit
LNAWLIAATVLVGVLMLCGVACLFVSPIHGLVIFEVAGTAATTLLLLLAEGFHRQSFVDLAFVFGALSFAGALTFARLFERL